MPVRYTSNTIGRSADLSRATSGRVHHWLRAIQTPTQYRVGRTSLYLNPVMVAKIGILILIILTFVVMIIPAADYSKGVNKRLSMHPPYNDTYPLSPPERTNDGTKYRIAAIADLDTDSKISDKSWCSYLKTGYLTLSKDHRSVSITWDSDIVTIKSAFSQGGRGMELSELTVFNGKLYTVDDRTGIIFQISRDYQAYPWAILADGNGENAKGFKAEWATVKDKALWIGGLGKEWTTTTGEVQNLNPQWVKSIGYHGDVLHHDWHEHYDAMRSVGNFLLPGYIIHESSVWSDIHKEWFFLPRRASREKYDDVADERRATNLLFRASDDFNTVHMSHMGPLNPTHGFSSFKFIPETNDNIIIALKSEEDQGTIVSYITALTVDGEIIMEEMKIGDNKFEGIEFV